MLRLFSSLTVLLALFLLLGCEDKSTSPQDQVLGSAADNYSEDAVLSEGDGVAYFEVTVENLTPATADGASQPFSPPVMATHSSKIGIFQKNQLASDELRQIAEDAVNLPMVDLLSGSDLVFDVAEGGDVILPAAYASFSIEAKAGYTNFSMVAMLVNTNDAFIGVNRVKLPKYGSRTFYLKAWDAGTEENTELTAHIPGPCCGNPLVRVPTSEKIKRHRGILGAGDLDPAVYNWDKAAAKLTITRVDG